jgi:2-deoxy-D-gluconate 3-dehydrogenase
MKYFDFTGMKAIVTGGSRGLGKGIVEAYLAEGIEVVIMAKKPTVLELAKDYETEGYACHGVQVDLANSEDRRRAFKEAMGLLGGNLDILVNAAGVQIRHPSEKFPLEDWNHVLEVNLTASFELCQLAAIHMIAKGRGKIINFASMLSFFGGFTVPAYAASKGGIAQITKAFSNEWASKGICVNAIAPGYMATEMNEALLANEGRYEEITNRIPAKRWGLPEDVAGLSLFLASNRSDYITGAIIPVDGGYLGK